MEKVKKAYQMSGNKANVMPLPLEQIKNVINNVIKNNYNSKDDLIYMNLLQSRVAKLLQPYVEMAIKEDLYTGSPIFNGYVDRDTIGTIVDKAIYYAKEDEQNIAEILKSEDLSNWSKSELLRAVVQAMVLHEIFAIVRPENSGDIKMDNNSSDNITPMPISMLMPMDM